MSRSKRDGDFTLASDENDGSTALVDDIFSSGSYDNFGCFYQILPVMTAMMRLIYLKMKNSDLQNTTLPFPSFGNDDTVQSKLGWVKDQSHELKLFP